MSSDARPPAGRPDAWVDPVTGASHDASGAPLRPPPPRPEAHPPRPGPAPQPADAGPAPHAPPPSFSPVPEAPRRAQSSGSTFRWAAVGVAGALMFAASVAGATWLASDRPSDRPSDVPTAEASTFDPTVLPGPTSGVVGIGPLTLNVPSGWGVETASDDDGTTVILTPAADDAWLRFTWQPDGNDVDTTCQDALDSHQVDLESDTGGISPVSWAPGRGDITAARCRLHGYGIGRSTYHAWQATAIQRTSEGDTVLEFGYEGPDTVPELSEWETYLGCSLASQLGGTLLDC